MKRYNLLIAVFGERPASMQSHDWSCPQPTPNNESEPEKLIQYIRNPGLTPDRQRRQLDLLERLNREHLAQCENDSQLEAAIQSMEVAFRMKTEAPDAFNIGRESEATRARYGDGDFARDCLMALRLAERGPGWCRFTWATGSRGTTTTTF